MSIGVLTDHEIVSALADGDLVVSPFDADLVRPAAMSVRLGEEAFVLRSEGPVDVIDPATHPRLVPRELDDLGRLRLDPGEVLLAPTLERIALSPRLAGLLDGTSDYARLGISVVLCHQVSPGFGYPTGAILTLEITSRLQHPVYLRPGTRIGNLMLFRTAGAHTPYSRMPANYSADTVVRASRLGATS